MLGKLKAVGSPNFKNNARIAWRFLWARKRSMLMSLSGIVFGVGFFIVTQAQTSGFEKFFIQSMLGVNGAARVEDKLQATFRSMEAAEDSEFKVNLESAVKYIPGIEYPARLKEAIERFSGVSGTSVVLRGSGLLRTNFREQFCKPYGIQLEEHMQVSDIGQQVRTGSIDAYRNNPYGLLVGIKLAKRMNLSVGDSVLLEAQNVPHRFRVSGLFETGIDQVDKERVYMHLQAARTVLKRPHGASFIQIALENPEAAPEFSAHVQSVTRYSTMSWQQREKTWLQVFRVLRLSSAITVSSIILIAGLGMFNTLVMIAVEKTREIAILRGMGYTQKDIAQIFLLQGSWVLVAGILCGWAFAAGATYGLSKLPIRIRGIFSADHFIVHWAFSHYITAAVIAAVIVLVAAWVPARRAARTNPGMIIRGMS